MLLSADGFCDPAGSDLTVELRRELLGRLGLYGLRFVMRQLRDDPALSAPVLSRALIAESGLEDLRRLIEERFLPRAQTLKARSAIAALRDIARSFARDDPSRARTLDAEIERAESSIADFAELRAAHLVLSGSVALTADQMAEVERVTEPGATDEARLDLVDGSAALDRRDAALAAIGRWRTHGSQPLNDTATTEVCDTVARAFEAVYVRSL
jgi:hypothetical protein